MSKIIVITGAGDGLGRALARRFARDGETVILLGRTLSKVQAVADELGAPHFALECDVGKPDSVRAAFASIAATHPKIDVLINNAAVYLPAALDTVDDENIRSTLDTNLAGVIYTTRAAVPMFTPGGHIINVTTEATPLNMPMHWLYAGTKAAVEHMSETWMRELAPQGIRVTIAQCGQMWDETKTGSAWPQDLAMRFHQANLEVGLNLRERGISHYNNVTEAFATIVNSSPDVQIAKVEIRGRPVPRALN
jgi:meso-butanediol dehydrogenase / (S,S)-butanediol dehydrogenase / diacetyl reductase